jgi:hypothetical protein
MPIWPSRPSRARRGTHNSRRAPTPAGAASSPPRRPLQPPAAKSTQLLLTCSAPKKSRVFRKQAHPHHVAVAVAVAVARNCPPDNLFAARLVQCSIWVARKLRSFGSLSLSRGRQTAVPAPANAATALADWTGRATRAGLQLPSLGETDNYAVVSALWKAPPSPPPVLLPCSVPVACWSSGPRLTPHGDTGLPIDQRLAAGTGDARAVVAAGTERENEGQDSSESGER